MYKVTDPKGGVHFCDNYSWAGDNIIMDSNHIIAGKPQMFTVEDMSAPPPSDPTEWLIDVGPFFDRFGAAKMAVLTSPDPIVRAIVQDVMSRKWIDLKRVDVEQGVDALISRGITGVDAALKDTILTTPVTFEEKRALAKLYFS